MGPTDSNDIYSWSELREKLSRPVIFPAMNVDIFRHGESSTNKQGLITGRQDVGLTPLGRKQACQVGSFLRSKYSFACSSSLRRSWETLRIALDCGGVGVGELRTDPRLDERSLGVLELKRQMRIAEFAMGDMCYAPPGGESYLELTRRILSFLVDLGDLAQQGSDSISILISTHVGPMRIFCGIIWRVTNSVDLLALSFSNAKLVRLSVSTLSWPEFIK